MSLAHSKLSEMLLQVSAALERAGLRWCILSGYKTYPEDVDPHDVDILVEPKRFFAVAEIMANLPDVNVVQYRLHEATAIRYEVVSYTAERTPVLLGIDVCSDIRDQGAILMGPEEFLAKRRRWREVFWVPEPSAEFAYYLLKKLGKSTRLGQAAFAAEHGIRLSDLYREDPAGCLWQLARFFPAAEARLIADAAESGHWEPICQQSVRLCKTMRRKVGREHPLNVLRYWVGDLRRRVKRVVRPTGLMVAFLGPDGAGKSTLMARMKQYFHPQAFRLAKSYHLRPHLGGVGCGPGGVRDPHAQPPRGVIPSVAKLGYWWVDYTAGYCAAVFPWLVRSTLVVFDRYYYDLLVDQRRYRYGGPVGLVRFVGRFVPQPHLVILLDTPAEVAQARKQDVPFAETVRQREAYLQLVRSVPHGYVVDASRPLDDVVTEAAWIILDYLAARTARRLGLKGSRWTGRQFSLQEHPG